MNEFEKIVRMNAYIQQQKGTLYLDGKEILCVSLDRTYATNEEEITVPLTDEQLEELLGQTYGKPPARPPREEDERKTHFQGFAKLLVDELEKAGFVNRIYGVRPYALIASRAYDLVEHTIEAMKSSIYTNAFTPDNLTKISKIVPDLDAWPEDGEK